MAQPIMSALDAIAGSQASAYITLADGNRCLLHAALFLRVQNGHLRS